MTEKHLFRTKQDFQKFKRSHKENEFTVYSIGTPLTFPCVGIKRNVSEFSDGIERLFLKERYEICDFVYLIDFDSIEA